MPHAQLFSQKISDASLCAGTHSHVAPPGTVPTPSRHAAPLPTKRDRRIAARPTPRLFCPRRSSHGPGQGRICGALRAAVITSVTEARGLLRAPRLRQPGPPLLLPHTSVVPPGLCVTKCGVLAVPKLGCRPPLWPPLPTPQNWGSGTEVNRPTRGLPSGRNSP